MIAETEAAVDGWRSGARLDLYGWTRALALRSPCARCSVSTWTAALATRRWRRSSSGCSFWGRDYVVQMLRGPGSPYGRMLRSREVLDRVIHEEIAHRRRSGERGQDILSLLLDATDEDGTGLSDQELRDQVMTLLFAGHDTTTSTVTFLFYELARNPEERARPAEADVATARLDMAVDETLRMYPPAWIGPRRSIEPFELCGVRVPGGVLVNYCSWVSHHLPEVFPEPGASGPIASRRTPRAALPKGAYVPFGGGSRTCIGMRFGLLEVRTIASTILRRFSLDLAEPQGPLSIRQMPTLCRAAGSLLSFGRRRERSRPAVDGRCLARTGDLHGVSVALYQLS